MIMPSVFILIFSSAISQPLQLNSSNHTKFESHLEIVPKKKSLSPAPEVPTIRFCALHPDHHDTKPNCVQCKRWRQRQMLITKTRLAVYEFKSPSPSPIAPTNRRKLARKVIDDDDSD